MNRRWHTFYPDGVPTEITVPSLSIYNLLEKTALDHGNRCAVINKDRQLSYDELKEHVDRLASALNKRGLEKGDRVALMFPNCVEYIMTYYAVLRLGGIIVQVNPLYQESELEHMFTDSGASWFVASYSQRDKVNALSSATKIQKIYFGNLQPQGNECDFYDLINQELHIELPMVDIDSKRDLAVLQYTGGTTGRAKGVMLTHYNLLANVIQGYSYSGDHYKRPGVRILSIVPFFHVLGMTSCINLPVYSAGTIICQERFNVDQTVELIKKYRPTIFPGVPTMYIALLHHPEATTELLSCFKLLVCGSAPMPIEVMNEFERKTGTRITEGYGLSESAPVTHRNPFEGLRKIGSIGLPLPGTDSKVVHAETGEECQPGEAGELIIKGPQVMPGYWKNEEATKKALQNGWLYSGDMAKMDEDGFFYIVGRKKDMIIAGGYNIYPTEVEEILYQYEGVEEVCVYGLPHYYRGETVKAAIVLREHSTCTEEEIITWCREKMARYKVPKVIEFRTSLPKTAVGKILRYQLVEEEIEKQKK